MRYSLLDLSPVPEGSSPADALRNTGDLARKAEAWGYHRYWLAEHHNMPGIASAATAVLIGHVVGLTDRMRVGSGGIMLPNHAPLAVAEAFGFVSGTDRPWSGARPGRGRSRDARAWRAS
jgi:luciferase family oxidoreductase group 1